MIKIKLPNNDILEVSLKVIDLLSTQKQFNGLPERGGLILGRSTHTNKTRILDLTFPYQKDKMGIFFFKRRDKKHLEYLEKAKEKLMYFKGNWHTHPQDIPTPSCVDKLSWKKVLRTSNVGEGKYAIFIIVGRKEIGIWAGDMKTKKIYKLHTRGGILDGRT